MKRTITALMALWILLLSGCATLAPSPTATAASTATPMPLSTISPEGIIGTWETFQEFYLRFNQDGTFQYAGGFPANLDDQPWQTGPFELEGELLTLTMSEDSLLCARERWVVEAQFTEDRVLVFITLEDSCEGRGSNPGDRTLWKPLSP